MGFACDEAYISLMPEDTKSARAIPTLEEWQHWTLVMGRAQQLLMEFWAEQMNKDQPFPAGRRPHSGSAISQAPPIQWR